ncbi:MAG: amidohydrolase, partial [Planctomycetota bacterium]
HAAMAYGASITLKRLEDCGKSPWPLAWRTIFQPAEETATGARRMIDAGALEDVGSIYALHVEPTRPTGEIGIRAGALTAHCDSVRIDVHGQGGHGARPHESKDPIAAAAHIISTLYQFVPRATDSMDAVVLTIGCVRGGQNPNVIPERVQLTGTLRTLEAGVRLKTIEHIHQLARGVGEITDTHIEVAFEASIPSVYNAPAAVKTLEDAAVGVVGRERLRKVPRPSMGSEDFACYLEQRPGAMFRLGVAGDMSQITPLHTPRFDIDEAALQIGVRVLAGAVVADCRPSDLGPKGQRSSILGENRA